MAKHLFPKGHEKFKGAGIQKGQKQAKTQAWEEMGEYMITDGAFRYMEIIMNLPDDDFLDRFENLIEYFKPKLQRSEIRAEVKTEITDSILKAFDQIDEAIQPEPDIPE